MSKRDKKYRGSIETEIFYNDPAETEVLSESFTFQGLAVGLHHGCGDSPFVTVDIPSKGYDDMSVFVTHGSDKIMFAHQYGEFKATVKEIEDALALVRAVRRIGRELIR